MHIVYVLPKQNFFAEGRRGRVAHAIGVARGLAATGARVTVLSGPGTKDAMQHEGVRCIEVDGPFSGVLGDWRWMTAALRTLESEIKHSAVDVVVVRYAVSTAFRVARLFRKVSGCLTCFEVNSLAYHQYHRLPLAMRRMFLFVERRILASADINTAVSAPLAADIDSGGGRGPRVVVLPNAADPCDVSTEQQPSQKIADIDTIRFVYMGVFQPYYELDLVVESFLRVREKGIDAELHLYGDGPQFDAIREQCEGAESIFLYGRYDLDELLASGVLHGKVVLLLPNRGSGMSEIGSPIKFYEYMSFGQAILASRVGQAGDLLKDEETCLFYTPGDRESCTAAMLRLATNNDLRRALAENVLSAFLAGHTWEARMASFRCELEALQDGSGTD